MCRKIIEKGSYLILLEWLLFFGLCGLSAIFIWGVLDKFISGKSSFTQSEEPINELPTIIMCFSSNGKFDGDSEYEYTSDFKIWYAVAPGSFGWLKIGKNVDTLETITLRKIKTFYSGTCYKVSSMPHSITKSRYTSLYLYFNKSISYKKLPYAKIYITSEKNAYGILEQIWYDGKVKIVLIEKEVWKQVNLKPQQYNYFKRNSKCRDDSFYECIEKLFVSKIDSCPIRCCPYHSLPGMPYCKTDQGNECLSSIYDTVHNSVMQENDTDPQCPKACKHLDYHGEETWTTKISNYAENEGMGTKMIISI